MYGRSADLKGKKKGDVGRRDQGDGIKILEG